MDIIPAILLYGPASFNAPTTLRQVHQMTLNIMKSKILCICPTVLVAPLLRRLILKAHLIYSNPMLQYCVGMLIH